MSDAMIISICQAVFGVSLLIAGGMLHRAISRVDRAVESLRATPRRIATDVATDGSATATSDCLADGSC